MKIDEKREELNKLIEASSSNLLSDEVLRVSQELDNLISTYLISEILKKYKLVSNFAFHNY